MEDVGILLEDMEVDSRRIILTRENPNISSRACKIELLQNSCLFHQPWIKPWSPLLHLLPVCLGLLSHHCIEATHDVQSYLRLQGAEQLQGGGPTASAAALKLNQISSNLIKLRFLDIRIYQDISGYHLVIKGDSRQWNSMEFPFSIPGSSHTR